MSFSFLFRGLMATVLGSAIGALAGGGVVAVCAIAHSTAYHHNGTQPSPLTVGVWMMAAVVVAVPVGVRSAREYWHPRNT